MEVSETSRTKMSSLRGACIDAVIASEAKQPPHGWLHTFLRQVGRCIRPRDCFVPRNDVYAEDAADRPMTAVIYRSWYRKGIRACGDLQSWFNSSSCLYTEN